MRDNPKFIKFEAFWNSEIEKKLFRCSKDLGFYVPLKKVLTSKNSPRYRRDRLFEIWEKHIAQLNQHKNYAVDFSEGGLLPNKRSYSVTTALHDNRHLSQIIIFYLFQHCKLDYTKFKTAFETMDKEIFKGHRFSSFMKEAWYYTKIFFS
jgi:hypothetical protein